MGEVYRAKDTRLNRTVAIKILSAHLRDDPNRRQRFLREAQAVAALDHPHICVLHDISQHDGVDFLVMEYLEGETLADRVTKGALPLHQVMRFAIEIADALDKAHRQGIVHRDLKPGNIMLTKQGAKLLDFGLAKLLPAQAGIIAGNSASLTQGAPITREGAILGTLHYMAPEQLEGKESDARTDIWAFGCTLYEMLTGKRAHDGKTGAAVIASILEREVSSVIEHQPSLPPLLEWIVRRCLAKPPDERWQTAADLVAALRWIAAAKPEPAARRFVPAALSAPLAWSIAAAAAIGLTAIGIWIVTQRSSGQNIPTTRLSIQLPSSAPPALGILGLNAVAISPDGTRLAYLCQSADEPRQICLRSIDSFDVTAVRGTAGAAGLFFSPDGDWIGFNAGNKLQKIAIAGGAPVVLADAPDVRGAAWGSDNTIVYVPDAASPLFRVAAAGGAITPVTTLDTAAGEIAHRWPAVLPGGALLYAARAGTPDEFNICVFSPRTGRSTVLMRRATFPRYAESGHLVFWKDGSIFAAPFDASRLELTGAAVPVIENVAGLGNSGLAQFALSDAGSLLYLRGDPYGGRRRLAWVNRSGFVQPISAPPRSYGSPRISPDGRHVALIARDPQVDVWRYDFEQERLARLTFDIRSEEQPIWSPDGKWITYTTAGQGPWHILRKAFDGSGVEELLFEHPHHQHAGSWTPDGKTLAFELLPESGSDIMIALLDDRRSTRPFMQTSFLERAPVFSPDARWMAYESNESGRVEVYVQAYPGPGGKWQVSTDGGTDPRWTIGGRELVYRNGDRIVAVTVETTRTFRVSDERLFFDQRHQTVTMEGGWDVSPDGQRLLMMKSEAQTETPKLDMVLNWFEELKRLVPSDLAAVR
jgi:dipeptidyl aminopeptidase/acylaminoacyl peptidase/predicted Ser/Thr protein kinase